MATRIVLGAVSPDSKLARTASDAPVISVVTADSAAAVAEGVELLRVSGKSRAEQLAALLDELGRRRMTNILIEGGAGVLGAALDGGLIDEAHAFIAPKLAGGAAAPSPFGGQGIEAMAEALRLEPLEVALTGGDLYCHGLVQRPPIKE